MIWKFLEWTEVAYAGVFLEVMLERNKHYVAHIIAYKLNLRLKSST